MQDLLLMALLGFFGSFGHCAGMCGPLTVVFAMPSGQEQIAKPNNWQKMLWFHSLLNIGRLLSYVLIGAGIGALSSVLVAGGQLAGIDSVVRQGIAIATGIMLIWFGLSQVGIKLKLNFGQKWNSHQWHDRLARAMVSLSLKTHWWTPILLGITWGCMPCGFLYAAQIKAAETGDAWLGGSTMLAFGLGTLPVMIGVGMSAALVSADRRSQLFRLGGWLAIAIGVITLLRNGDPMTDYTGHASLFLLMLALVARPISNIWAFPLHFRRAIGVGAFVLAVAHTAHMLEHSLSWNLRAISFMLPSHQVGIWTGITALVFILPAAITSFDSMVRILGEYWRQIHLLALPALILGIIHTILLGSNYLGNLSWTSANKLHVGLLILITLLVLLSRSAKVWDALALGKFYVGAPREATKSNQESRLD